VIKSIPNVGPFFAWQILCDLTDASVITVNSLDYWAELGPGACKGWMYIFQCSLSEQFSLMKKLFVITKQTDRKFSSLSIPPALTIKCKLVEHALCEFSKYCRTSTQDLGANNENQSVFPYIQQIPFIFHHSTQDFTTPPSQNCFVYSKYNITINLQNTQKYEY